MLTKYKIELNGLLASIDPQILIDLAQVLRCCKGIVFIAGNGGSASNAGHLALHLNQAGIRAVSLPDMVASMTAAANDFGYEECFVRVTGPLRHEDVVLVISCSGNSPNILRLLKAAKQTNTYRIGLLGNNGGKALKQCLLSIFLFPAPAGITEDIHSVIIHLMTDLLGKRALDKRPPDVL